VGTLPYINIMKIVAIVPKSFDYLVSTIIEGLYENNVKVIASESSNNVKKAYSSKEIIKHSKDADYILVLRGKVKGNIPPKYYLLDKIKRPSITAYIDGSEWTYLGYPEKNQIIESLTKPSKRKGKQWIDKRMFSYCRWYFKRECYPEDAKIGIIPLLFAAEKRYFGNYNLKKTIDIFCSFGQKSSGLRSEVERICMDLRQEGYKVIIKSGLLYETYKRFISSSYITIDAWGGGDCTGRIWEIFANRSCCFSQKYNILFPNSFTDGINYVEYSIIEEFEEKLRFYLNNEDNCIEIAQRGYEHLLKYHTSKERVKYMLKILKDDTKSYQKEKLYLIGKRVYLNVILRSFLKNPRNVYLHIWHSFKEFRLKYRKAKIKAKNLHG